MSTIVNNENPSMDTSGQGGSEDPPPLTEVDVGSQDTSPQPSQNEDNSSVMPTLAETSEPKVDLLSAFQAGLEQTMSLVAHMPEEVRLKAFEAIKGLLPTDNSSSLDSTQNESRTDQENKQQSSTTTKISGSAKRKIPARAGLPKKLTTSPCKKSSAPASTAGDQSESGVEGGSTRGRPGRRPAVLEEDSGDREVTVGRPRRARRRKQPWIVSDDDDDENDATVITNVKQERLDSPAAQNEISNNSSTVKREVKEELPPMDLEYEDDVTDEDWSSRRPIRRSARNARKWHRKIYKQESKSRTGGVPVSPDKATVVKLDNGDWKCSVCDKISAVKQNITVHLRTHTLERPYQCTECDKTFSVLTNMQRHCRDRHGEEPTVFCPIEDCSYKGWSEKSLSEHMSREHPEQKTLYKQAECPECHKVFANKHLLKVHSGIHEKERPYVCVLCNKTFSFKTNLTRHMWTHKDTDEYPHHCHLCDKKYIEKKSLDAHIARDHEGKKLPSPEKTIDCEFCDKKFACKGNYQNHLYVHNGQKPHVCSVCGKGFSMRSNMQRHEKLHMGIKPWPCPECGKCFTEKKTMEIHFRIHSGQRPYKCKECGKAFAQAGTLQSHLIVHSKERNFLCGFCGKSFLRKSHYNFHMKKHNSSPNHPCDECDMKFYRKGDLIRHKMVHTNEKPYLCSLCPKRFTRLQYLKEHTNQHTGLRPHKCKQCDQAFGDSSSLYKHLRTHNQPKNQQHVEPTLLGMAPQTVTHVTQLPPGMNIAMETTPAAVAGSMDVVPVTMGQQQQLMEGHAGDVAAVDPGALTEETIYADLGGAGADRTYVCKMCQASLPSLEACYTHQREHGHVEVSFLVTVREPEIQVQVEVEEPTVTGEGQETGVQDVAAQDVTTVVTDQGLANIIMPTGHIPLTGESTAISLDNMMQITQFVTAGDVAQEPQTMDPQAQITEITEDQMINAVTSIAGNNAAATYYTTDAAQSVAMTMEELSGVLQGATSQQQRAPQQTQLILLSEK